MRRYLLASRVIKVYAALLAATMLSLGLFENAGSAAQRRAASLAVIAIAFVKVRWIGLDFMELRRAPAGLRVAFEAWVLIMALVLAMLDHSTG